MKYEPAIRNGVLITQLSSFLDCLKVDFDATQFVKHMCLAFSHACHMCVIHMLHVLYACLSCSWWVLYSSVYQPVQ